MAERPSPGTAAALVTGLVLGVLAGWLVGLLRAPAAPAPRATPDAGQAPGGAA